VETTCQSEYWPTVSRVSSRSVELLLKPTGGDHAESGPSHYRARYYDASPGRFLNEDPQDFGGSGPNFYTYVFNSPMNLLDPTGWKPGDKYPSLKCAGFNAAKDINPTSRHKSPAWPFGREYGGWLYQNPDGTYSYASPVPGGPRGVSPGDFTPIPSGTSLAGAYHTHGAFDPAVNAADNPRPGTPGYNPLHDGNEIFGPRDKHNLDNLNLPGFLGTPQGTIREYIPKPGHPLEGKTVALPANTCGCQ
jgi:RHS repeat-associated protein